MTRDVIAPQCVTAEIELRTDRLAIQSATIRLTTPLDPPATLAHYSTVLYTLINPYEEQEFVLVDCQNQTCISFNIS